MRSPQQMRVENNSEFELGNVFVPAQVESGNSGEERGPEEEMRRRDTLILLGRQRDAWSLVR